MKMTYEEWKEYYGYTSSNESIIKQWYLDWCEEENNNKL